MWDDLKLAWRQLRSDPGFALTAVLTLGIAVGANAAVFMVADAVLFRPLPYGNPERLFAVRSVDQFGVASAAVPYEYIQAIERHHTGVEGVALRSTPTLMMHAGVGGGEDIETFAAAPDYFRVLGVQPVRGRLFEADDVNDPSRRVMLSYDTWWVRFAADETIIGRGVTFGGTNRTVVGVLPPGFIFPSESIARSDGSATGRPQFVLVAAPPASDWDRSKGNSIVRAGLAIDPVVRLSRGVTKPQAQAQLDALVAAISPPRPMDATRRIVIEDLRTVLFPKGRQVLVLLLTSAGLVLLLGCANLANMLLARAHRRQSELAVRAALGAGRLRLVRPIVFETLIVGISAAALAIGVTATVSDALVREVPPVAYGRAVIGFDLRVAALSLLLGIAGGMSFAVLPAWRASRLDVQAAIHNRGGLRTAFGGPMMTLQVALAILLVIGAFSAARRLVLVLNDPRGFDAENILVLHANPRLNPEALSSFYDRIVTNLRLHPAVLQASAGQTTAYDSLRAHESSWKPPEEVVWREVRPGYFETLGMRLEAGRFPTTEDAFSDTEPAILSEGAARKLIPGRSAVGERLTIDKGPVVRIIGVVQDEISLGSGMLPSAYRVPGKTNSMQKFIVKTRQQNLQTLEGIRREVVALVAPDEAVTAQWLSDSIGSLDTFRGPRFQGLVLGAFGTLALGLAALGMFAIMTAQVASRTREMGIRLAIGAEPRRVRSLVLRAAFKPMAAGAILGLGAAGIARDIARSQIPGFDAAGPLAAAAAVAVVATAGLLAAYLPARRASRVDPLIVLRAE